MMLLTISLFALLLSSSNNHAMIHGFLKVEDLEASRKVGITDEEKASFMKRQVAENCEQAAGLIGKIKQLIVRANCLDAWKKAQFCSIGGMGIANQYFREGRVYDDNGFDLLVGSDIAWAMAKKASGKISDSECPELQTQLRDLVIQLGKADTEAIETSKYEKWKSTQK